MISTQTRDTLREAWQQTSDPARRWIEHHIQESKNGNPESDQLLSHYAKLFRTHHNGVTAHRLVMQIDPEQLEIEPPM